MSDKRLTWTDADQVTITPPGERQRQLRALAAAHDKWILMHQSVWKPEDASPGPSGTDYNIHAADRSASADEEAKFARAADRAMSGASSLTASADHSGVMLALVPDPAVAAALMELSGGTEALEEQHLTLLYLGSTDDAGGDHALVVQAVTDFAAVTPPLTGNVNGWGVFHNDNRGGGDDENVLVALWDIPGIAEFRTALRQSCLDAGVPLIEDTHGFTPHETMRYEPDPITVVPGPVSGESVFAAVFVAWGNDPWDEVPLTP